MTNNNTVTESETLDEEIEEIRSTYNSPMVGDKLLVVVEGNDDVSFYQTIISGKKVYFYTFDGCYLLPEIIKACGHDAELKENVIGIKDADFDNLEGKSYDSIEGLFLTDYHDIEMMLLHSRAVNKVLTLYRCQRTNVVDEIFSKVSLLSYLRFYNQTEILDNKQSALNGISFAGFKPTWLVDHSPVSLKDFLNKIESFNNKDKKGFPNEDEFDTFIRNHHIDKEGQFNLHRGHDIVSCLSHVISVEIKKYNKGCNNKKDYIGLPGKNEIERDLILSYTFDDFKQTNIFHKMENWCNNHHRNIWIQS